MKHNYPNPFNPETTINFELPQNSQVNLNIYNIKGQLVKPVVSSVRSAGSHSVLWSGTNDINQPISSGIYFYKLVTGTFSEIKKMVLLR